MYYRFFSLNGIVKLLRNNILKFFTTQKRFDVVKIKSFILLIRVKRSLASMICYFLFPRLYLKELVCGNDILRYIFSKLILLSVLIYTDKQHRIFNGLSWLIKQKIFNKIKNILIFSIYYYLYGETKDYICRDLLAV